MPSTVIVDRLDLTLDLLVWRALGSTAGLVEQTLSLNPGLSAAGELLPLGQKVLLPDPPTGPVRLATVNLWD